MTESEKIKHLEQQIKELHDILKEKRTKEIVSNNYSLPKKTAAAEAHVQVLAGRNIGVVGIGSAVLILMVAIINSVAASITAFVCIGVMGYMVFMRVRMAQYLEQKYALESKPIFNKPEKKGGFSI